MTKNKITKLKELIKKEGNGEKGEVLGLSYLIWRHPDFGHLNGYVGVPNKSNLSGKKYYYYTKSENEFSKIEKSINEIDVHGGLTFSGEMRAKSGNNLWYFGFDCGHYTDFSPILAKKLPGLNHSQSTYKDKKFIMREIKKLAKQLNKIIKI